MTSPLELLPNTYRAFFSGFPSLTSAQKELIQPILHGDDVILQASTGTGKTEAVLAPATERLLTHPGYFTIIYIVPTRALALDIHRRINSIYKILDLKSGIRTGDGKHLRDGKPHLLIMTPESLDVMLGSGNQNNNYFLNHVHVMVIDEVHVFLRDDRGYQLAYLHRRLAMRLSRSLQTLALSATIDNGEDIQRLFKFNKPPFYYKQSTLRKLEPCWVHMEDEEQELTLFFDDLHRRWRCKKLLVFANSRKKCEQVYGILHQNNAFSKNAYLHYSNLSTQERKSIEASFRDGKMGVCIATSTLELGIDIGDVDGVVLIGPPPSTMAFLQRIGRGNRRQQYSRFWGICYGHNAGMQLIRFLAFFELAKEHQVEKCFGSDRYSVLFQQILSCLYAKQTISKKSLNLLFPETSEDLHPIFHHMLVNHWLEPTKQAEIYKGGWRYFSSLKRKQIWSNFPPTEEEYDVILEDEKIALLPLSMVKQLEIGDCVRLIGRVLRVLHIEEKKAGCEVLVEESKEVPNKALVWAGLGPPTPFEVAQKMGELLLGEVTPAGLLNRTKRLLEQEREKIRSSFEQPNGIRVHRRGNGMYRYETFLGSVPNYILYQVIERQFAPLIKGLIVSFDEMGLECNVWIPFGRLKIPDGAEQFQDWVSSYLSVLKGGFSWNSWIRWLPEEYQRREMASRLDDPRVLKHFQRYMSESQWLPLPSHHADGVKEIAINPIPLKGTPWSLENEKNGWGMLVFPDLPSEGDFAADLPLSATQVQGYVAQRLCPRWARFQQLDYRIEPHPRLSARGQNNSSRRKGESDFEKEVIGLLRNQANVYFETEEFGWQKAIERVLVEKEPLFLAQGKLKWESLRGSPDLIYIQYRESHICLEVWDIKCSQAISYAQKWRIAFCAYLLENLLKRETFSGLVEVSCCATMVHPSLGRKEPFKKTPFDLSPYTAWMPRLVAQWKADSGRNSAIQSYCLDSFCTSCPYFSYCYNENIFNSSPAPEHRTLISRNIVSNDFPNNSKQWYFIHYDVESLWWQCWENGVSITEGSIHSRDVPHEEPFEQEVADQLQKVWSLSVAQGKNPHFLVYEAAQWHLFEKKFNSTSLKSLWAEHVCWTSIQSVLQTHFIWPFEGRITPTQVGACLGLTSRPLEPPLSLYHKEPFSEDSLPLCRSIWDWCLSNVKSRRVVSFGRVNEPSVPLIRAYLRMYHRETECRTHDILEFQKLPMEERVKQFRAIGPLRFRDMTPKGGYQFSIEADLTTSKLRVGDFLKLSLAKSDQIQEGFSVILDTYLPEQRLLSVTHLHKKMGFQRDQLYVLDEDATDWNGPKIKRVLTLLQNPKFCPEVIQILLGNKKNFLSQMTSLKEQWVEQWYQSNARAIGLNPLQQQALKLPFRENIGLIEGPPGTGKTHLLVWTLIALIAHAKFLHRPIKILVTAHTHHAIDQILAKVAQALPATDVSAVSLWKYGHSKGGEMGQLEGGKGLYDSSYLILGATGYGVYQLLEGKNFPKLFDWIVFDEASQILAPYALISLIFGKGQALFYGDTQQLPPVLKGHYENTTFPPRSILEELIFRYGAQNRVRLNETYRMSAEICQFASDLWYNGDLRSLVAQEEERLKLPNYPLFRDSIDDDLDPSQSMVVVQLDHFGCQQSSSEEAKWIAKAVRRLVEDYSISPKEIGIISPHRLQNHTILSALKEASPFLLKFPRIDTVERMQGLEFDIVIFSATVSDSERVHSHFLKDYRRFNVSLTRARKKFIFVSSPLFFQAFPKTERELLAQMPFEKFFNLSIDARKFVRLKDFSPTLNGPLV